MFTCCIIANGKLLANDTPKNLENKFLNKNTLSIKVSNKINNVISKDIKSLIKYDDVKIQKQTCQSYNFSK